MIGGKENFLTDNWKYYLCGGLQRKAEVCRSPERSICEHLSKLGEQSQKVNRPVNTTGNQAGLLRRTLSALMKILFNVCGGDRLCVGQVLQVVHVWDGLGHLLYKLFVLVAFLSVQKLRGEHHVEVFSHSGGHLTRGQIHRSLLVQIVYFQSHLQYCFLSVVL